MLADDYDPINTEAPEPAAQRGSQTTGGPAEVHQAATEPARLAAAAKSKCAAKSDGGCRKITVSAKAHSRVRKLPEDDTSEDDSGDNEDVAIGRGVHSKALASGRIRPRRKESWNDRSTLCGVFLNGNSGRVQHIPADARRRVRYSHCFTRR